MTHLCAPHKDHIPLLVTRGTMNDGDMSNQLADDNYQPLSNARQIVNNSARSNLPDGGVGARVMRNTNDWKWGKQVKCHSLCSH